MPFPSHPCTTHRGTVADGSAVAEVFVVSVVRLLTTALVGSGRGRPAVRGLRRRSRHTLIRGATATGATVAEVFVLGVVRLITTALVGGSGTEEEHDHHLRHLAGERVEKKKRAW